MALVSQGSSRARVPNTFYLANNNDKEV